MNLDEHLETVMRVDLQYYCKQYPNDLVAKYQNLPFENHCYMRMAYDNAVEDKWDKVIQKPFYANAENPILQKALQNMMLMYKDENFVHEFNRKSLEYRGKLKIE